MLKIPAAIAAAITFCGLGAWYVPRNAPVAYVRHLVADGPNSPYDKFAAEDALGKAQAIPESDCVLMATTLRQQQPDIRVEDIRRNNRGGWNCRFDSHGIPHSKIVALNDGFLINDDVFVRADADTLKRGGPAFLAEHPGRLYVNRPVYSLFHTRMSIEFGHDGGDFGEGGGGRYCIYNRFSGTWRLERCGIAWIS